MAILKRPGKRTVFDEYRLQSRGGVGIKTMNCTDKTGRATQGVKLITLNDKESIQDISLVIADDDDEPAEDTPAAEEPADSTENTASEP